MKILPPKSDVIFKLLFGDIRNKRLLAFLLMAILGLDREEFEELIIVDPHLKREHEKDKLGIVDVKVITKGKKIIHIEIQVLPVKDMPERVTYYNSKAFVAQLSKGDTYGELRKTISIVITDYEIVEDANDYHHIFQLRDNKTAKLFTDIIEIHTLEMQKLPLSSDGTELADWLMFLRAEKEEEFEMLAQKNPAIKEAYIELQRISKDEKARKIYEDREKALRDERDRLKWAQMQGRDEGLREGKREVAMNLLKYKMPIEQVSDITGLSIKEIQDLADR